jgi:hypothetical protein
MRARGRRRSNRFSLEWNAGYDRGSGVAGVEYGGREDDQVAAELDDRETAVGQSRGRRGDS